MLIILRISVSRNFEIKIRYNNMYLTMPKNKNCDATTTWEWVGVA